MKPCRQCDGRGGYKQVNASGNSEWETCPRCQGSKIEPGQRYDNPRSVNMDQGYQKSANDKQHGGDHYAAKYQHWDWIVDVGLGYFESAATKYVTRYRDKNGLQDLEKSDHYLEKMLEHVTALKYFRIRPGQPTKYVDMTDQFCDANDIEGMERAFMHVVADWQEAEDISSARNILHHITDAYRAAQPGHTGPRAAKGIPASGGGKAAPSGPPAGQLWSTYAAGAVLAVGKDVVVSETEFHKGENMLGWIGKITGRDGLRCEVEFNNLGAGRGRKVWLACTKLKPYDGMFNVRGYTGGD